MTAGDIELLRRAWDAYARGDIDAAAAVLHPQVRWCAADKPDADGNCHNRGEAVAFIQRSLADGVSAEALDFRDAGERVVVVVQTHQPPEWGEQPEPHGEVVTIRGGQVVETSGHAEDRRRPIGPTRGTGRRTCAASSTRP